MSVDGQRISSSSRLSSPFQNKLYISGIIDISIWYELRNVDNFAVGPGCKGQCMPLEISNAWF